MGHCTGDPTWLVRQRIHMADVHGRRFPQCHPGILVQLILIPAIMVALNRTGLVPFRKMKPDVVPAENNR